jgi:predicted nucleic acid-binding protein
MIVVDASVLTDALTDDGEVGDASRAALQRDPHWAAPAHLALEVASAIRGGLLGGKIMLERAADAVDVLRRLEIDPVDPVALLPRIWQLRSNLTVYDAAYVAAAEALGCPLLTGDARLARASGLSCPVQVVA